MFLPGRAPAQRQQACMHAAACRWPREPADENERFLILAGWLAQIWRRIQNLCDISAESGRPCPF
jgi:hypothetical protein